MKTFNRLLRVAMSHKVVPRVLSVVFSPVVVYGYEYVRTLGTRLLVSWLFLHPGKTVENVLKITDFFVKSIC